jgi:hypothetical protein
MSHPKSEVNVGRKSGATFFGHRNGSRHVISVVSVAFFAVWLLFGIGAAIVASGRGANGFGWFVLGVLLGPIGFALAFTTGTRCPKCASVVSLNAKICPKCREPLARKAFGAYQCPNCKSLITWNDPICQNCKKPINWISVTGTKRCPDCAEEVRAEARKCRFCGFVFPDAPVMSAEPTRFEAGSNQPAREKLQGTVGVRKHRLVFLLISGVVVIAALVFVFASQIRQPPTEEAVSLSEAKRVFDAAKDSILLNHPDYRAENFEAWSTVTVKKRGEVYSVTVPYYESASVSKRYSCRFVKRSGVSCQLAH